MPEATVYGSLLAGLFGSAHCLAMCGGIAGAVGVAGGQAGRMQRTLLYNLGRVSSYTVAGAAAGGASLVLGSLIDLPTWSMVARILAGTVLIVMGLNIALQWRLLSAIETAGAGLWRHIAPSAQRLLASSHPLAMLGLGALWGWLPCGLVYSALLIAIASGSALDGAATMFAFGLGTLPSMLAAGATAAGILRITRQRGVRWLAGALLVTMGAWTGLQPILKMPQPHSHHGAQTSELRPARQGSVEPGQASQVAV